MEDISKDLHDAMRAGRACPVRFMRCDLLAGGKTVPADAFVASVKELIGDRKTYIFVQNSESAEAVACGLNAIGVRAAAIRWRTSFKKGARVVQEFREGSLQVVVGGQTLIHAPINAPDVSCIVLIRRSSSQAEYNQMIGKGVRLAPGKSDCLVIDYTGEP